MLNYAGKIFRAFFTRKIDFTVDMIPFMFDGLPLRKMINWLLTEGSILYKPSRPWGFPTLVHLEPTSHCNLRCVTCPVTEGLKRASGHMDLELFKKIVDDLGPYLLLILLWDWGEPFLNPNIYEMITHARKRKIKLMASTNGHVFAKENHAQNVVASGLDALIFSVDGITQKTYERYRAGGRLESVIKGIRKVVAEKRRQGSRTPLLNFRYIVMKHNEHELPDLEKFVRTLDVDLLTFRKFFPVVKQQVPDEGQKVSDPDDPFYQRFEQQPETTGLQRVENNPCKNLWNCPAIHWNGTVCPCTCDYNENSVFGNLKAQNFDDIWSGRAARDMRRAFRRHWQTLPLCTDCVYAFKGGDMGRESVTEAIFFHQAGSPETKAN
jgi:radical SAM protein with 4Fe4S-binding SPASM domain